MDVLPIQIQELFLLFQRRKRRGGVPVTFRELSEFGLRQRRPDPSLWEFPNASFTPAINSFLWGEQMKATGLPVEPDLFIFVQAQLSNGFLEIFLSFNIFFIFF